MLLVCLGKSESASESPPTRLLWYTSPFSLEKKNIGLIITLLLDDDDGVDPVVVVMLLAEVVIVVAPL